MKKFNYTKWLIDLKHGKTINEGMSDEEWTDAKEKERLEKHPEKDKYLEIAQKLEYILIGKLTSPKMSFFKMMEMELLMT